MKAFETFFNKLFDAVEKDENKNGFLSIRKATNSKEWQNKNERRTRQGEKATKRERQTDRTQIQNTVEALIEKTKEKVGRK